MSGRGNAAAGLIGCLAAGDEPNAVDPQRPGNILQALLAEIGELSLDLAAHLPKGVVRDADAAGLGDTFKPGCDVDAVAKDVFSLDQHIADVDADAPFHAAFRRGLGIPLRRQPLQPQSAFECADHRAELDQEPVAGRLDDPSAMLRDQGISGAPVLA